MEKPPPPDPCCPICKKTGQFSRIVNAQVEFWECETKHMFIVDRKPPPRVAIPVAATPASASPSEPASTSEGET